MQQPEPPLSLFARANASVGILYREVAKFGVIGAVAFVVDIGIFNLLRSGVIGGDHGLAEKPLTAKTISVLAATIVAWVGNRYWTFRHRRRASPQREFVLFGVMNIGGLAISLACLAFSHYVLGLRSALADNIAGNVIGLGLGTLFRFWAYRQLVFTAELGDDLETPTPGTEPDHHEPAQSPVGSLMLELELHERSRMFPEKAKATTGPISFPNAGSAQRGEM
jgi:putative flippase GtrA